MTNAWVFPGQGSQTVNMGLDLLETAEGRRRFAEAEQILGWSVVDCCQEGGDRLTRNSQPCLYTVEAILIDLMEGQNCPPAFVAGHSLGEYAALYAAKVFNFETGLELVKQRAALMANAENGTMVALIGFDRETLDTAIESIAGVVKANDNSPVQVVISGLPDAVQNILKIVPCKRAIPLNVSGAFHSPLMAEAANSFSQILEPIPFATAIYPVLSNIEPEPSTDPLVLKTRLQQQITGSVRWREITLRLAELEVQGIVEIGPGNVLTGLMRRTCKAFALQNITAAADIAKNFVPA